MAATQPLPRYADPLYQSAHDDTFAKPIIKDIETVLPPGVSRGDFGEALKEIQESLGQDAVFTGSDLREYVDPYEIPESGHERNLPSAAVCPSSVPELQAILKVANKYIIPVWTISRGKNLGYGGPAPKARGSVVLDLHRMNKVLEVSEKFAYAVVEPGVTFGDLYTYCAENKLKVWPSTASLGWGSIIGNTLDRGMGFVPTGLHHEHIAGMEVVLANGDVVRTGQFAKTDSPSAHLTKLSFGPTVDGLFLQSNLGIVTKMGIYLTPQPQAYMACEFAMPEMNDLATITDLFGYLRRNGTIPYLTYVFSIGEWISFYGRRADWWDGSASAAIPDWRLREIMRELGTGFWTARFGLYGPKRLVEAQYTEVRAAVERRAPTGTLKGKLYAAVGGDGDGGDGSDALLQATSVDLSHGGMFVGVPSMFSLPLVDYYNRRPDSLGAHSAYSPIVPLDGAVMLDWVSAARAVYERHGLDLSCDFFMHERYAVFVCMLPFDKTDPAQRTIIDKVFHELFEEGSRRGFAKYRSHINHMDQNAELFDFNDHAYRRFVETLKDSLDENGILSPGKNGIWPKRLRLGASH
ncbi:hypothetical protein DL769_002474 [Monosporascus sp. CRB-8-3]|nr:hypothetical protein DL769_002474 [Monosporascus sp. CRB-8-3]